MRFSTALTALTVCAMMIPSALARSIEDEAVRKTVKNIAQAADRQDVSAIEPLLHKSYVAFFVVPGAPGESSFDRATYIKLLASKKIGGDARSVEIVSVDRRDRLAFVRTKLNGAKASFDMQQTLVKTKTGWQLLAETMVFQPKKG